MNESVQSTQREWPKRLDGSWYYYPKITLFGPPGVGKTTLAATAPRPFFMSCDPEGTISIADSGHLWWDVRSIPQMRECWNWLVHNMDQYDTIVVDTLTNLQIQGMDEIIDPTELKLGKNIWGMSFRQMRSVIAGLCAFPDKNVIFICTDKLRDDELGFLKILMPDVPPSQFKLLNINCRLMAYLYVERQKDAETGEMVPHRWLQTFNDGRIMCKDNSAALDKQIWVPPPPYNTGLLSNIIDQMRSSQQEVNIEEPSEADPTEDTIEE